MYIKAGAGSACHPSVYGDDSTTLNNDWHQVLTTTGTPLSGITELSFSGTAVLAIGSPGSVDVWVLNTFNGASSVAPVRSRATPVVLHSDFSLAMVVRKAEIIQSGTNGAAQFLLGANGTVYSIGGNLNGVLGIGSIADQTSWTALSLPNVTRLSSNNPFPNGYYSIGALTVTGTLYLWGSNANGILGAGSTVNVTTPAVPSLAPLGMGVQQLIISMLLKWAVSKRLYLRNRLLLTRITNSCLPVSTMAEQREM